MVKSYRELVEEAKKEVGEVSADEFREKLNADEDFVLIDCRDPDLTSTGRATFRGPSLLAGGRLSSRSTTSSPMAKGP